MELKSYTFTGNEDREIFRNHGEILDQYGSLYRSEHEPLYVAYRDLEWRIQDNAREIQKWNLKDEKLPSEALIKEQKISELKAKQAALISDQNKLPIGENLAVVFKAATQLNAVLFNESDSMKLTDLINGNHASLRSLDDEIEKRLQAPQFVVETKEQRQDRRLKICEDVGLVMPKSSAGRLPDGVGAAAKREGVTRQAFTDDVKAALKRREGAKREGLTVHRA